MGSIHHEADPRERLSACRRQIDFIDEQTFKFWPVFLTTKGGNYGEAVTELNSLYADRMSIMKKLIAAKNALGSEVVQTDRRQQVESRYVDMAEETGIDPEIMKFAYELIHEAHVRKQERLETAV